MPLSEHDHDMTRRYLLGQLTDDEEQKLEERLLSEDDFFQEVELTKDELAQEYASGELTAEEHKWLQENFLASSEGKQRHEFAKTFDRYVRKQHEKRQKSPNLIERLRALWNAQPQLLTAASTAAVLLIAIGIYSIIPTSTPRSFANLTVTHRPGTTRSGGTGSAQRVNLKEKDALKLTLMLPQAVSPGSTFRVQVSPSDNNAGPTFEPHAQDSQSITVEIPAADLPRGQYVASIFTIDANSNADPIPGFYPFIVE